MDAWSPARLCSRTGKAMNNAYPDIAEALESEPSSDFVIVAISYAMTGLKRSSA